MLKIYDYMIELKGKSGALFPVYDDLKMNGKATIPAAKKMFKKLSKITGLDVGELTFFNDNCTIKFWLEYDGEKVNRREW